MGLTEQHIDCPYCGEPITILLDEGDAGVDYTEDCQVCCRPMVVSVWLDDEALPRADVRREDE